MGAQALARRSVVEADHRWTYWNDRYERCGMLYGDQPSLAARLAAAYVNGSARVLELGGAYGRNAQAFLGRCEGFDLIDLSPAATAMAQRPVASFPADWMKVTCDDFLTGKLGSPTVVFSNFVFHLLFQRECQTMFQRVADALPTDGLFINSFLCTDDLENGVGIVIEPGTFLHEIGRFNHFWGEAELRAIHQAHGFELLRIERHLEQEHINGRVRDTAFWFTVARPAAPGGRR